MKNNVKTISSKLFKKQRLVVTSLLALVFVAMSVGYAAYYSELKAESSIGVLPTKIQGDIFDLDITKASTMGDSTDGDISYDKVKVDGGINFTVKMTAGLGYKTWLRYETTVVNHSDINYTYMGSDAVTSFKDYSNKERPIKYPIISGMVKGDVIGPGETKKIYISFYADDKDYENFGGKYTLSSNLILSFSAGRVKTQRPSYLTSLIDTEVTLDSRKNGQINFNLTSLFDCSEVLSFYIEDSDIELLVSSGEDTESNRIVNKGANDALIAVLHLKRGIPQKSEYHTKLMGKILYEAEGTEEVFEIGDIVIYNDSEAEEPAEVLKNVKIEYTFNSNSWPGHATASVKLTNNNNFDITQWVVRIYVNPEAQVTEIDGSQHKLEIDTEQSRLMIYSDNRYGVDHYAIGAKSSITIDGIQMVITGVKERPNSWTTIYYDIEVAKVMVDAYYNGQWHYGMVLE